MYLARSFGRNDLLDHPREGLLRTLQSILADSCNDDSVQETHYKIQSRIYEVAYGAIVEGNGNWSIARLLDEIFGNAIWDLRALVTRIYSVNSSKKGKYPQMWANLESGIFAVVNLNYDTTFEQALDGELGDIPILKPHGSLGWSNSNRWILGRSYLYPGPWPSFRKRVPQEELGYKLTAVDGMFDFKQPLIVAPDDYKEEIVGGSSTWGIVDPILRQDWKEMRKQAIKAHHWLFAGFSFGSGDNHLGFLLGDVYRARKKDIQIHITHLPEDDCCKIGRYYEKAMNLDTGSICFHKLGGRDHIDELLKTPSSSECRLCKKPNVDSSE